MIIYIAAPIRTDIRECVFEIGTRELDLLERVLRRVDSDLRVEATARGFVVVDRFEARVAVIRKSTSGPYRFAVGYASNRRRRPDGFALSHDGLALLYDVMGGDVWVKDAVLMAAREDNPQVQLAKPLEIAVPMDDTKIMEFETAKSIPSLAAERVGSRIILQVPEKTIVYRLNYPNAATGMTIYDLPTGEQIQVDDHGGWTIFVAATNHQQPKDGLDLRTQNGI